MDFLAYELGKLGKSTGTQFQGTASKLAIQKVVGRNFRREPSLISACKFWVDRMLGAEALGDTSGTKWRFVKILLRERDAASIFPDEVAQPERSLKGHAGR